MKLVGKEGRIKRGGGAMILWILDTSTTFFFISLSLPTVVVE